MTDGILDEFHYADVGFGGVCAEEHSEVLETGEAETFDPEFLVVGWLRPVGPFTQA